jgi:tRNA 2-thiouridine synthesizing protein A
MTSDWKYDRTLDTSGLKCPLPVLKARKVLLAMKPGERLMVIATNPLSAIDMPHFASESGNRVVATAIDGDQLLFLLEKEAAPR